MDTTRISVLIIGSGPNAVAARDWDRSAFTHIVAINNACQVRPDWDYAIFPEDFPVARRPKPGQGQTLIDAEQYVPVQNRFGGFVYAGGTMAFTAGYWALGALRPDVMAFVGCNMVYPAQGNTHFYGVGTADPLRLDVTLQTLEAKSARLEIIAAQQGCACVNLSDAQSRLVFPRTTLANLSRATPMQPDPQALAQAEQMERALGYMVASGRYWDVQEEFDAAALRDLDALWLDAHGAPVAHARRKRA